MADGTAIEWTDATLNVVNGCSVVSPGCTNCYAMRSGGRNLPNHPATGLTKPSKAGHVWTGEVRFNDKALLQPLRWKRPRKIFWNAHGDLFHEAVPDEWIDRCFAVMALTPQHIHQVLTKRPERMREWATDPKAAQRVWAAVDDLIERWDDGEIKTRLTVFDGDPKLPALAAHGASWGGQLPWPLRNVWLGVSVEDQQRADERIPVLLDTPAAMRWLSCEPLLGPVDLGEWFVCPNWSDDIPMDMTTGLRECCAKCDYTGIAGFSGLPIVDWVVVGGESGPGARPMHPAWARSLRDQCAAAGVPFLFKQWGEWVPGGVFAALDLGDRKRRVEERFFSALPVYRVGKKVAGRLLDGVQHDGYPA